MGAQTAGPNYALRRWENGLEGRALGGGWSTLNSQGRWSGKGSMRVVGVALSGGVNAGRRTADEPGVNAEGSRAGWILGWSRVSESDVVDI